MRNAGKSDRGEERQICTRTETDVGTEMYT